MGSTSVANYAHSRAISGADLYLNNNAGAVYTLDVFRRLLTHEIGHALGLGDVEGDINPGDFIDDNYLAGSAATLNNSWAGLVDPLNPSGSVGLGLYSIGNDSTLAGVNLLMESRGLGISAGNPLSNQVPLTNDEYGTRQFLYPVLPGSFNVPEPGSLLLSATALLGLLGSRRVRSARV